MFVKIPDSTVELPCYNILIQLLDGEVDYSTSVVRIKYGGGNIISNLHEKDDDSSSLDESQKIALFNAGIDALESIILAHAVAGIDVTAPAYIEGIETAAQALGNEHS